MAFWEFRRKAVGINSGGEILSTCLAEETSVGRLRVFLSTF